MKASLVVATIAASLVFTSCAMNHKPVFLGPVGPAETKPLQSVHEGELEVYTARRQRDVYPNLVDYVSENRWDMVFFKGHTDYTIYTAKNELYRRVRNAHSADDGTPTLVRLPAGIYRVSADAEDYADDIIPVMITVEVVPGQKTTILLARDWRWIIPPSRREELVTLPNGRPIGWRAEVPLISSP